MDSSKRLLCFCAVFVLSTVNFAVSGCSDQIPCQPGFSCSPDNECRPNGDLITPFPTEIKDPHISNGIPSHRNLRQTNILDEAGESILMGNEGIENYNGRKLSAKDGHKHHRHRSQSHKYKIHSNSVGTSKNDGIKNQWNGRDEHKVNQLSDSGMHKSQTSGNKDYREFPRSKRSIPVSQWQKILDTLKHGVSHEKSNADVGTAKQVEILEEIQHQLEEEVTKSEAARHGHHRLQPLVDIEAKKEEIQVLKEIEDSLQQTPPSEDNHAMITGAHTHSSSHHHKHEQLHGGGKPLNDANNQINHAHDTHGHNKEHTEAKPNLNELEEVIFKDILEAESDGVTKKQGVQLERELESLQEIEKQTTEDLIKNSGPQTNLDEVVERLQLWGVLQQLKQKLKTEFPNTKLSRERRSTSANAHSERERGKRGSLLSLLQKARANLEAHRHHKQAQSMKQAPTNTPPAPTKQQVKASVSIEDTEDEIGLVNKERCVRCEPLIGEEVCGYNGKTYVSLCHAVNCAGLRESDIIAGRCVEEDECASNKCSSEREQCVPMTHGTCLALYSKDGYNRLPCTRYTCVSKEECANAGDHAEVCGEDGKTYPSLCYLHKAGVQLAYTGSCRAHLCQGQVCANNGITYESSCHARAHGVRIDYTGECFTEDRDSKLVNCATVREAGRCDKLQCNDPVLPTGACCPVCGGAILVHPDSAALAELVNSWEEINHLYVVENFLRHILSKEEATKCELMATLTNSGDFSIVLSAATATDHGICLNAGKNLVQAINKKSPSTQDAMLHPIAMTAALMNPFNPEATIKGFLLKSQNQMMSKASDLRDQAADRANDALIKADRHVKEKQYSSSVANKATGQSMTLSTLIWTYACAIVCAIAMLVA